jgi:hypothetical protein
MSQAISRRDFFGATLAAVLPAMVRSASPGPKRLVAGTRWLEMNGRPARVFGLVGPDGGGPRCQGPRCQGPRCRGPG